MYQQHLTKGDKMPNLLNNQNTIGVYLFEIGKIPLLKPHEEIELAQNIQKLMRIEEYQKTFEEKPTKRKSNGKNFNIKGTKKASKTKEISNKELAKLVGISEQELIKIQQVGKAAKIKMVESNLKMVVSIAKLFVNQGIALPDLIQEGSLGVIRAAEKFDPTKGYKFSTYCYWWIRQAILRAFQNQKGAYRLPCHIREKINKINKITKKYRHEYRRKPTNAELAAELNVTESYIEELKSHMVDTLSLNVKIGEDREMELGDTIICEKEEEYLETLDKDVSIKLLLKKLTPQERRVITLLYGLKTGIELSRTKTADEMNVTRQRVHQLEKSALEKMRKLSCKM